MIGIIDQQHTDKRKYDNCDNTDPKIDYGFIFGIGKVYRIINRFPKKQEKTCPKGPDNQETITTVWN